VCQLEQQQHLLMAVQLAGFLKSLMVSNLQAKVNTVDV
jgi:hypothetical protein